MKKLLLLLISASFFSGCNSNTPSAEPTKVEHATLLLATNGSVYNFNLDDYKTTWHYTSPLDSTGNRNFFALDGQNIFMPFESGKLINFDVNTGKIIWKQQIYGNEDQPLGMSSDINDQNEMIQALMPLFMSKPLVDGQNIIIPSVGKPGQSGAWLYNFNRANGEKKWNSQLPTIFNMFAPVKYHNFYFVNSAVFLNMYSPEAGTNTSYGMFDGDVQIAGEPEQHNEVSQFDRPIYSQMQSDGKSLFIGDEHGKIYCFQLDKNGSVPNGDITDPNNTFTKNPKIFKWTFSDDYFNFQENKTSFLENGLFYTVIKEGTAKESCIFAINTYDGKPKWKKVIKADVLNWSFSKGKITGNTQNTIFYADADGQNFTEVSITSKPLSNIESVDKTHLIYATQKGIEIFDTATKTAKLVLAKTFRNSEYNNFQIRYIPK
ncbi:PQQ-binding-like beta-propeller repeat protein [Elizabethkingia meningoseptica]|uniref:outer membrane protein assembly factor BamB family protein n=1 Tax=Elizabethkingia meningoseptica TaxID=238 RepID=UPI0023AE8614|nr:PQQ-binding-like beta-propeller repeat protein [Elizabethkingia meningoseptica]MDE5490857.1 PQQ-like beta-propeller repeat protein [Elizabethkingia meningoseptica]